MEYNGFYGKPEDRVAQVKIDGIKYDVYHHGTFTEIASGNQVVAAFSEGNPEPVQRLRAVYGRVAGWQSQAKVYGSLETIAKAVPEEVRQEVSMNIGLIARE